MTAVARYNDPWARLEPNGFDICPDVLRFWCENGRVCQDEETNAHFASFATA
jgi:hypothetical protein